jgi:hypothetical protein
MTVKWIKICDNEIFFSHVLLNSKMLQWQIRERKRRI